MRCILAVLRLCTSAAAAASYSAAGSPFHNVHRGRTYFLPPHHTTLFRYLFLTVFNFIHRPVLSAPPLILSASRFPVSDFPLLVLVPFPYSAPLNGTIFPFLFERNPLWILSNPSSKHVCFFMPYKNISPALFPSRAAVFLPSSRPLLIICLTSVRVADCV